MGLVAKSNLGRLLKRLPGENCRRKVASQWMHKIGNITFEFIGETELLDTHVFRADNYNGEPTESDEMRPQWFDSDKIPFGQMWVDDILWFPLMLQNKFFGYFKFQGHDLIIDHKLEEVEKLYDRLLASDSFILYQRAFPHCCLPETSLEKYCRIPTDSSYPCSYSVPRNPQVFVNLQTLCCQ
ncbi:unnamed protein product [Oncorhynchus mykiss]|uniref:Uncharacterized protein n=1 Tax=Oncorhynchus mykiss TaxID=8022 RepID=A0A060WAA9_ONCMY|nr:unnamed protein product [Oncorhynchus mykiss]